MWQRPIPQLKNNNIIICHAAAICYVQLMIISLIDIWIILCVFDTVMQINAFNNFKFSIIEFQNAIVFNVWILEEEFIMKSSTWNYVISISINWINWSLRAGLKEFISFKTHFKHSFRSIMSSLNVVAFRTITK